MNLAPELLRFLRHALAPLIVLAVERGWLPEAAQNDVAEALAILVGFVVVYIWSRRNARREAAQRPEDAP